MQFLTNRGVCYIAPPTSSRGCTHSFPFLLSAGAFQVVQLPDHVQSSDEGDEANTHGQHDRGSDLQPWGIICVEPEHVVGVSTKSSSSTPTGSRRPPSPQSSRRRIAPSRRSSSGRSPTPTSRHHGRCLTLRRTLRHRLPHRQQPQQHRKTTLAAIPMPQTRLIEAKHSVSRVDLHNPASNLHYFLPVSQCMQPFARTTLPTPKSKR